MLTIKSRPLRRFLKTAVPFVLIPVIAVVGTALFKGKRHMIVSLCAAFFTLLLFAAGYEKKSIGTRKAAAASVMTALSFAGRFIPFFKPVAALTIITGIHLGSETGFLVGAMTALLTDFYFGQGPWTPFQMLAWGITGYIAGIAAAPLNKSRPMLVCFGVFAGLLFSLIMDVWSVLWYAGTFSPKLYAAAIVTALPHTLLYAVSNAFYLYVLAPPFAEKLNRLKIKSGMD